MRNHPVFCVGRHILEGTGGQWPQRGEWGRSKSRYSRKQKGSGAFGARVQAAIGLTPLAAPVPPTERAGSEGSFICRRRQAAIYSSPEGRYHNPLNPLNLLNPLNPHAQRACPMAIPPPSGPQGLSNFRTLRTFGPLGPSTLQRPKGAESYSSAFPSSTISAAFSHRSPRRRPAAKKRSQDMLEEDRGRDSMNASSRGMESPAALRAS